MTSIRVAVAIAAFASVSMLAGCGGGGSNAPELAPKTGEFVPSFGSNGIATLDGGPFTGTTASARFASADSASGVIRATGNLKSSSVRARLRPDGSPDATFAGTGYVLNPAEIATLPFSTERSGLAVFARPDGSELLVESVHLPCMTGPSCGLGGGGSTYPAARLVDATGAPVPGYGAANTGGEAQLVIEPTQVVAEPSGAVLVLGQVFAGIGGIRRNSLQRLTPQGLRDDAFATSAAASLDCPGFNPVGSPGAAMTRRPDGKLLVAQTYFTGSYANPPSDEFTTCLTRLLPDGTVDATFGAGGRSQLPREFQFDHMTPVAIFTLPNGGSALFLQKRRSLEGKLHYHYMIATMTADGALDASRFDRGITGPTDLHVAWLVAVAMQADGKYLVAGYPSIPDNPPPYLADRTARYDNSQPRIGRLLPEGGADLTFGPLGAGYTPLISFGQRLAPWHVSIGPDRGIFVAGSLGAAGPVNDNEITKFAVGKLMGDSAAGQ